MSILGTLGRAAIRAWAKSEIAPGYLYQVIDRVGPFLGNKKGMLARLPNGCLMQCNLREHVQRQVFFYGAYEPVESFLFTHLLQPEMVVFDLGANIGQYSLLAATAVGAKGQVHSFEPIPQNFRKLKEHIEQNQLKNIFANELAAWSGPGKLKLGRSSAFSANDGSFSVAEKNEDSIEATAMAIDHYVEQKKIGRVDLVKIDIEGAEPQALLGMQETLRKFKPTLLCEINQNALASARTSAGAIQEQLFSLGYRAWRIRHDAELCGPVSDLSQIAQGNVIFHSSALPDSVTRGWKVRDALRWARRG